MNEIERITPDTLRAALRVLLASPESENGASATRIATFCEYLTHCPVDWRGWRAGAAESPEALLLAMLLPGNTAIVMIPTPAHLGIERTAQLELSRLAMRELEGVRLHYAQALLDPTGGAQRVLLEEVGFSYLATLMYLERQVTYPWVDPPGAGAAEWVSYSPETHGRFAKVVLATYGDSLDCPELAGLRPIEDVLAAHRCGGKFDAGLWELAHINSEDVGCMLLSRVVNAPLLEIVYMGVVPPWRGRGVGTLLMRRALEQCRARAARDATVVVDARNGPARALYERFAFRPVTYREAMLYGW